MKKEAKKLTVIDEWGQSEFENRGIRIEVAKWWLPYVVIFFATFVLFERAISIGSTLWEDILVKVMVAEYIGGFLALCIAGRRFWHKMSTMISPVKLEKIPSIWWIFNRK